MLQQRSLCSAVALLALGIYLPTLLREVTASTAACIDVLHQKCLSSIVISYRSTLLPGRSSGARKERGLLISISPVEGLVQ